MEGFFRYWIKDHTNAELQKIVAGKDSYGISCFSLTSTEILMWTHYANNHQGVCIEVDIDLNQNANISFEPIKYNEHIPWLKKETGENLESKTILCSKIKKWDYEQEIRAFCDGKNTSHIFGEITQIFLGTKIGQTNKDLIQGWAGNIPVKETKIDFDANIIIV